MRRSVALGIVAVGVLALVACGDAPPAPIAYGTPGPLVGEAGRGSFRFGAASAATQIEDMNPNTDWYLWTQPVDQGGLGNGAAFVGDATQGFSRVMDDLGLV